LIVHVAPANEMALHRQRFLPFPESQLRIAVIDENPVRAAIIEDGLAEVGERDVFVISERSGMARAIETIDPDVILIDLGNPSRDMLEEYFAVSRAVSRPIAMFVEQSDQDTIAAAIDAGVSAYIVDGLSQRRIKPILDLAVRRFQAFSRLQAELKEARDALSERTVIDNAKKILIRKRNISEPEAHKLLRDHAMNSNKRMAEVAEAIVTADQLLGGGL
jgi:response regulator NasT